MLHWHRLESERRRLHFWWNIFEKSFRVSRSNQLVVGIGMMQGGMCRITSVGNNMFDTLVLGLEFVLQLCCG